MVHLQKWERNLKRKWVALHCICSNPNKTRLWFSF
jgi:hypothetical protein